MCIQTNKNTGTHGFFLSLSHTHTNTLLCAPHGDTTSHLLPALLSKKAAPEHLDQNKMRALLLPFLHDLFIYSTGAQMKIKPSDNWINTSHKKIKKNTRLCIEKSARSLPSQKLMWRLGFLCKHSLILNGHSSVFRLILDMTFSWKMSSWEIGKCPWLWKKLKPWLCHSDAIRVISISAWDLKTNFCSKAFKQEEEEDQVAL